MKYHSNNMIPGKMYQAIFYCGRRTDDTWCDAARWAVRIGEGNWNTKKQIWIEGPFMLLEIGRNLNTIIASTGEKCYYSKRNHGATADDNRQFEEVVAQED